MAVSSEFASVFGRLRAILAAYAPKLTVVEDREDCYSLDTQTIGKNKHPIAFGAVSVGKSYVSYHFMPVYGELIRGLSPSLKNHMQGKACFNFRSVDEALFKELEQVTERGYLAWKKLEWVD
jgi:hypothetical protein